MDMFKILTKFSEMDRQTLNESEKGVTKHKGKYGTSHKAGDEPHKGDDGDKKSSDTSHLQAFLGKKPADHDSKEGRVHTLSNEPPKDSKYDDGDEAPKKRGRPKKNLKDWIEALDEMIAEAATAQPMGATAGGAGNAPGSGQFTVRPASNNTVQLVSPEGVVVKTENMAARSALGITAAELNKAAALKAQQDAQKTAQQSQSSSTTQPVTEEELDEKWDAETKVAPSEKGKYEGKTKEELLKMYNALKKRGPHKEGSPEFGKMRELQFAIRAKSGWGKVDEADVTYGAQASPLTMANQQGKKMKKIKEGTDPHEAARSEGRSHAMAGHPYSCRHNKGTMEAQCYHEGYVHALEECYGQQNDGAMEEDALMPPKRDIFRGKPDVSTVEPFKRPAPGTSKDLGRQMPGSGLPMHGDQFDDGPIVGAVRSGVNKLRGMFKEDDIEESPFSWAAKNTKTGDEFTVGGKTFTKKADEGMYEEDLDAIASDPMLENWDKQLNSLLNEGLTVTTSTGQQGAADSVSISATDEDAQKLMDLLKMSGLSMGGAMSGDRSAAQSTEEPADDYRDEGDDSIAHYSGEERLMPMGNLFSRNVEDEVGVVEPYGHDEVIDGLDCSDAMKRITNKLMALESMEMPDGMGMSTEPTEDERDAPEPYDQEEIMGALEKGGPKGSSKKKSAPADDKEDVTEGELPMPAGKGMSKNVPEKGPKPKKALEIDEVVDALDGHEAKPEKSPFGKKGIAEDTMDMPAGKGMSKNVEPKQPTPKKPLEQDKIVKDLKRSAPKSEKSPFSKKDLEESALPMPDGMGMSVQSKDKEHEIPEPKDYEQVEKELAKGGGKEEEEADRAFAALKRLIQSQMPKPSGELPKADGEQEVTEPSDSDTDDFENVRDSEDHREHKKMDESREQCDECGAMYEGAKDDHTCEAEHLDEWANSLRDGKKSKLKDEQFMTDSKYMTDTSSGGLNRKKPDQTVTPHTKVKVGESRDDLINEWLKLSGIR